MKKEAKIFLNKKEGVNMNIEIKRLNHTGDGIGEIDSKVIFVPKTIPGDIVTVDRIKDHGNYFIGMKKEFLEKNPNRIKISCPYYESCGGCQLMGMSYLEQLKYKESKVKDILKKYAGIEWEPEIIPSPLQENYRNKITLQVKNNQIGLFQTNTNDLVPIERCLLVKEKINDLLPILQKELNLSQVKQILIKEHQEQLMIMILGNPDIQQVKQVLKNKVSSIYVNDKHIIGKTKLEEKLGRYYYYISPKSFFQVNYDQTINLYNKIKEYLGKNNKNVLDLYCGAASIGIYVSDNCKKIKGIEQNVSSTDDAKENIIKNKLENIEVLLGDVGHLLEAKNTYDAIILDPPRTGLDKKTKVTLLKIKSPKLIYVSCNPITLARDIKELSHLYEIKDLTLFDMFPNTYHVECVVLLSLKNSLIL